ncbi:hypothetical protein L3X38_021105 [Prunus dulcis]|uniref:Uncharacterized protein n=1 Tax=Prunus dulcis TaxID=3755 RepID=A0AAD4VV05_PRUDU|nr:hypothetical protein L3X38_021105 [Prunus dulcis]
MADNHPSKPTTNSSPSLLFQFLSVGIGSSPCCTFLLLSLKVQTLRASPPQGLEPGQEAHSLGFGPPGQHLQPGQALGPTSLGKPKGRFCLGFSPRALMLVLMSR